MICGTCGAENPAGARFCNECGARLSAVCGTCGASNVPTARFCNECGSRLEGAPATAVVASTVAVAPAALPAGSGAVAVGAERRLVSVLFADLVGFTPYAEERDPEETRELLTRYFDVARDVIERYGGTVEKFIGDAVMAVFGTPVAHEDDAERAVRAGLELVDAVQALGPTIQARCGVLTGEAAVTIGATDQGMVAGDLVNTAARLQSVAEPGSVLVGEPTMLAASAAITFERVGEQALKGKAVPVTAWRALRVAAGSGGRGRSDLPEPPFVGRDEELRTLKDVLAASSRDPRTRLVSITGPGGIGKSRLAWEFEKYADGLVEAIWWHQGRSPSYGQGISFWALGEMVRRRAGLSEEDDEATTRERIAATVAAHVPDPADREWIEPALLTLLGLEPAPPGGRDVLFAAWRMFFERIAAQGTTVLLFEDLQWADTGLLDFLDHLLEWSRGVPLVVVTLARPELFDRRPGWGTATRNLTAMALQPLPPEAMRELLEGFVPGLPAEASGAILDRAEGIPLYAVEMVRALVADGRLERVDGSYRPTGELGSLTVPDTLRSLIASRLDALETEDRSLLQEAAVLGHTFTPAGLAAVSGRDVDELEPSLRGMVRRELLEVESDPRSPERGQYRFVQSLIREVAYGMLAKRDRRSRHLAVARYFESLGDEELAGALATHYLAAFEASAPGPEADAVAAQARLALRAAAERAATLGAHDEAVTFLEQALRITIEAHEQIELLSRAATSAAIAARYDAAEDLARRGLEAAQAAGDAVAAGRVAAVLGSVLLDGSEPGPAAEVLASALDGLETVETGAGADTVRARLLTNLARAHYRLDRAEAAYETVDRALAMAERLQLEDVLADALNNKAAALSQMGRNREAAALMRAAIDIASANGLVAAELRARSNLASVTWGVDPRGIRAIEEPAFELAKRVGNRMMANWIAGFLAALAYQTGERWDETLAELAALLPYTTSLADESALRGAACWLTIVRGEDPREALAAAEAYAAQSTNPGADAQLAFLLSHAALTRGDPETAYVQAMRATAYRSQEELYLAWAARAALWMRDIERARTVAERQDALPDAQSMLPSTQRASLLAGIAALDGRRDEATAGYRDVLRRFEAMGHHFLRAMAALDFLIVLGPGEPAAAQAATEARQVFERVGARPLLERLDEALSATGLEPHETRAAGASSTSTPAKGTRG
jgi:class 3 adenylate cyclase/tetratricopeptide (TPR) repeat protein/ribosomal protein L40E